MSIHHAAPGEVLDTRQDGQSTEDRTTTLVKNDPLQIIRMVMAAGKEIPTHQAPGYLIVQCLQGRMEFAAMGKQHVLEPGQLLYLPPHEPHSVRCVESGALMLTIFTGKISEVDEVQEASEDSFPASDSPGWTGASN